MKRSFQLFLVISIVFCYLFYHKKSELEVSSSLEEETFTHSIKNQTSSFSPQALPISIETQEKWKTKWEECLPHIKSPKSLEDFLTEIDRYFEEKLELTKHWDNYIFETKEKKILTLQVISSDEPNRMGQMEAKIFEEDDDGFPVPKELTYEQRWDHQKTYHSLQQRYGSHRHQQSYSISGSNLWGKIEKEDNVVTILTLYLDSKKLDCYQKENITYCQCFTQTLDKE